MGNLAKLTAFAAQNNYLTSTLPPSLRNCTELQFLWLGRNQLSGTLPPGLGSLSNVWQLSLESNAFVGHLPASLSSLANVLRVVVDDNPRISGPLVTLQNKTNSTTCSVLGTHIEISAPGSAKMDRQCGLSDHQYCAPPTPQQIPNLAFRSCDKGAKHGSSCEYECAPGYVPAFANKVPHDSNGTTSNRGQLRCRNGEWLDIDRATCTWCNFCCGRVSPAILPHADQESLRRCIGTPRPTDIETDTHKWTHSLCSFGCQADYMAQGVGRLRCTSRGTWIAYAGSCGPRPCSTPSIPNIAHNSCHNTSPGTTCHFGCRSPFVPRPSSAAITCVRHKTWRDLPSNDSACVCGPVPGSLAPFANTTACAGRTAPGGICLARCNNQYYHGPKQEMHCDSNGTWNLRPCTPCPGPCHDVFRDESCSVVLVRAAMLSILVVASVACALQRRCVRNRNARLQRWLGLGVLFLFGVLILTFLNMIALVINPAPAPVQNAFTYLPFCVTMMPYHDSPYRRWLDPPCPGQSDGTP